MQTLRWLRVPGDTLFAAGAVGLVLFVVGLRNKAAIHQEQEIEGQVLNPK